MQLELSTEDFLSRGWYKIGHYDASIPSYSLSFAYHINAALQWEIFQREGNRFHVKKRMYMVPDTGSAATQGLDWYTVKEFALPLNNGNDLEVLMDLLKLPVHDDRERITRRRNFLGKGFVHSSYESDKPENANRHVGYYKHKLPITVIMYKDGAWSLLENSKSYDESFLKDPDYLVHFVIGAAHSDVFNRNFWFDPWKAADIDNNTFVPAMPGTTYKMPEFVTEKPHKFKVENRYTEKASEWGPVEYRDDNTIPRILVYKSGALQPYPIGMDIKFNPELHVAVVDMIHFKYLYDVITWDIKNETPKK